MPLPRASGIVRSAANRGALARRLLLGLGVLAVGLLGSACANVPHSTVLPKTEAARVIQDLYVGIFWAAVVVFVLTQTGLVYILWRYRQREGNELPAQIHGNTKLEVLWTVFPAVILVFVAVPTIRDIFYLETPARSSPDGSPVLEVEVIGKQWWWEYRYPAELGGIVTANEMVLPVGRTAVLKVTSDNVIHSFWVQQLMGKMDAIPGQINEIWFTPEEPGQYFGQCAEYCGIQHANMRMNVIAMTPGDFDAWVARSRVPAQPLQNAAAVSPETVALVQAGQEAFALNGCVGCHSVDPTTSENKIGPNLAHVGSRTTLASGIIPNTHKDMKHWLENPQEVKPGNSMPNLLLRPQDLEALAAYLHSLK
jgi:cytochrome c oxidase subunit II